MELVFFWLWNPVTFSVSKANGAIGIETKEITMSFRKIAPVKKAHCKPAPAAKKPAPKKPAPKRRPIDHKG